MCQHRSTLWWHLGKPPPTNSAEFFELRGGINPFLEKLKKITHICGWRLPLLYEQQPILAMLLPLSETSLNAQMLPAGLPLIEDIAFPKGRPAGPEKN